MDQSLDDIITSKQGGRRPNRSGGALKNNSRNSQRYTPYSRARPAAGPRDEVSKLQAENARLRAQLAAAGLSFGGGGGGRASAPRAAAPRRGGGTQFKVSENSEVNKVAGAISNQVREAGAPTLLAIGPGSANQAVKAIAGARRNLYEEEIDLIAEPYFPYGDESGEIHITLRKSSMINDALSTSDVTVKPTSEFTKVAGAIAGRIREGERVNVICRGKVGVFLAVKSIEVAGRYLEADGINVKFTAQFVTEEDDATALHLSVLARHID